MVYILCIYIYIHRYIYMCMFTLLPSVFIGFRNSQLQGLHIPTSLGDATACGWKLIWINRPMTGGWNLIRMCHGQLSYTGFNSRIVISYMVISYCHVSPRYRADRVFYHITYPISTNLRLSHACLFAYGDLQLLGTKCQPNKSTITHRIPSLSVLLQLPSLHIIPPF